MDKKNFPLRSFYHLWQHDWSTDFQSCVCAFYIYFTAVLRAKLSTPNLLHHLKIRTRDVSTRVRDDTITPHFTPGAEHHNNFCPLVMWCFERYKEQRLDEKCAVLLINIKIKKQNCLLSLLNTTHYFNRYFTLQLVLDYRLDDCEIGLQIPTDTRTHKKCVLFFTLCKRALELTQPPIQWVTNVFSPWAKRLWV